VSVVELFSDEDELLEPIGEGLAAGLADISGEDMLDEPDIDDEEPGASDAALEGALASGEAASPAGLGDVCAKLGSVKAIAVASADAPTRRLNRGFMNECSLLGLSEAPATYVPWRESGVLPAIDVYSSIRFGLSGFV
jgi:hypothetical protein